MRLARLGWPAVLCVCAGLLLWGCADQRTTCGRVGEAHVVCSRDGLLEELAQVEIRTAGKVQTVLRAPFSSTGGRPDLPQSEIEIVNLPAGWHTIRALQKDGSGIALAGEKTPLPPGDPMGARLPWFLRHWVLTLLFLFMTLYVAVTCIETGGPNHGEHPFLVTVVHLIVFYWLVEDWDPGSYDLYRTLLWSALGYSIFCRLTVGTPLRYVNAVAMVALYGALFYLINVSDYRAVAQWTSQDVVQLYVPERDRGYLEALDPNGKALRRVALTAPRGRWVLYIAAPEEPLSGFRVVPPGGPPYPLQIHPQRAPR